MTTTVDDSGLGICEEGVWTHVGWRCDFHGLIICEEFDVYPAC